MLCIVAPTALFASTDTPLPELTSFAYSRIHSVAPLPDAVIHRVADGRASNYEAHTLAPTPVPLEARAEPQPLSRSSVCSTVASVARANDLPVTFFANLIWQESNFNSRSVSPAGAQGIAQFMPKTAAEVGLMNPFEPIQALHAAGRFLRQLREQFGNLGLAAAAYNAGPGRVLDWVTRRKTLPGETRHYVLRITGHPADRWTAPDARHDPEVRLMPAHAPCVEVAEAVAHQVKTVRVTRLMSELAAATDSSTSPPRRGPAGDKQENAASVVASAAPHRRHGAVRVAAAASKTQRPAAPKSLLTGLAEALPASQPAAKAARPAVTRLAARVRPPAARKAATQLAALKTSAPKAAAAKPAAPKTAKPTAVAHSHAPSRRTRVASAR